MNLIWICNLELVLSDSKWVLSTLDVGLRVHDLRRCGIKDGITTYRASQVENSQDLTEHHLDSVLPCRRIQIPILRPAAQVGVKSRRGDDGGIAS